MLGCSPEFSPETLSAFPPVGVSALCCDADGRVWAASPFKGVPLELAGLAVCEMMLPAEIASSDSLVWLGGSGFELPELVLVTRTEPAATARFTLTSPTIMIGTVDGTASDVSLREKRKALKKLSPPPFCSWGRN